jgi:hypothetical protein
MHVSVSSVRYAAADTNTSQHAIAIPTNAKQYFGVILLQGLLQYVSAAYVAIFREV